MSDALAAPDALSWYRVGRLDEIPPRGARVVGVAGQPIAIFRTSDDGVFALLDRCPHRGGPLSQGIVHGHCVTCPLHDWVIDLATGKARSPDNGATRSFRVRIEGGIVLLGLASAGLRRCAAPGSEPARVALLR